MRHRAASRTDQILLVLTSVTQAVLQPEPASDTADASTQFYGWTAGFILFLISRIPGAYAPCSHAMRQSINQRLDEINDSVSSVRWGQSINTWPRGSPQPTLPTRTNPTRSQ